MSTLAWPSAWLPSAFELRISPNTRTFNSPYSNESQIVDLGGERWRAMVTLPPRLTEADGMAQEAFFDQLAGGINNVGLWHFKRPTPRGTFAAAALPFTWTNSGAFTWTNGGAFSWTYGTPALLSSVVAGANTCTLRSVSGRTALAGDMLSINGETKRILADSTADGSGAMSVTFAPRARADWPAYAPIVTTRPTITFQILGEVPTQWVPGSASGATFEALEVINP